MKIEKLIKIILLFSFIFVLNASTTLAQYCSGGAICVEQGFERICSNSGDYCSGNSDCGPGDRCTTHPIIVNEDQASCRVSGFSCAGSCPRGGFIGQPCGAPYYPPVVTPTPYIPPPSPGQTPGPTPTGDPGSYVCNPCSGTCQSGPGGSSIQACQASCYILPADDPQCVTGGGGNDPNAGASSCPDVIERTTSDIVLPGETKTWFTWAPPPGATAAERLQNLSPGSVTRSYTSPGDKITAVYMFQIVESEPHSFYVYDEEDDTYYFLAHDNKPPVIFSRKQEVVDNAIKLGYTLIENPNNSAESKNAAGAIDKRVYKLIDKDAENDNPWKDENGNKRGVTYHAPYGQGLRHIPYVNCASLFNASGHSRYYSTNINDLRNDKGYCFQRQNIPLRFPQDDEEDEFTGQYPAGNYLGLEEDVRAARAGDPDYTPDIFGYDGSGDIIWPRTGILIGPRWEYFDNFGFAFLETKGQYLARPDQNNIQFTPGFMRQAILQIPTDLLVGQGEHDFHAFIAIGAPGNSTPVGDENSSQNCAIETDDDVCEESQGDLCHKYDEIIPVPQKCKNFKVVDQSNGQVISSGGKVKIGHTYTISSNAQNESKLYAFYNSTFNDPKPTNSSAEIENWRRSSNINSFEIKDCTTIGGCNEESGEDINVLKLAQAPQADQGYTLAETEYFETGENVTGSTFQVEFWAKVDGATPKTIPNLIVERNPYVKPSSSTKFDPVFNPADSRDLRFPVYNTASTTSSSITVTNQWQKFIGTVSFTYDTTNPTGHPDGSESTKIKLKLKAPLDGTAIYYDNFTVIGWRQPTVYYRMASALTPAENDTFNQCSLSTHAGPTYTNLSGGLFWADLTIPQDRTPGLYNMFVAMETSPGKTYFGNPNATTNCNLNRENWDDSIADTCRLEVEVIACNDETPALPTVSFVNSAANTLPNLPTNPVATRFNDFRTTNDQLTMIVNAGGNTTQKEAVSAMVMNIDPYNTSDPNQSIPSDTSKLIEGVPIGNGGFLFTYDLENQYTNEITIFIQAINENACNESGELVSPRYKRNIRLMRQRSGYLINIPKEEYETYNCRDTKESLVGKGQSNRLVNLTNPDPDEPSFTTMQLTVNTVGTFNPIVAQYSSSFGEFKKLSLGAVSNYFITDLPYNPPNSTAWRNNVSSYTLDLPAHTTEESYICLEKCNPNVGSDLNPRCQAGNSVPYMSIPKPQYPGYPHTERTNDLNIYVGKGNFNDAWWQTRGGLIFAEGTILSNLPIFNGNPRTTCQANMANDVCQPYMDAKALGFPGGNTPPDKSHNSAGIVVSDGNSIDAPGGYITQRTSSSQQLVESAATATNPEDYSYFWDDMIPDKTSAKVLPLSSGTLSSKPTGAPDYDSNPAENVRVYRRGTDSADQNLFIDLSGTNTISVPSGEKIIVFVKGNLNIGGDNQDMFNKITVAPGGFLAFIVKGNIVIETTVGTNNVTETRPVIEGVYLAGGTITVQGADPTNPDKKFIGRGSFVGLGGINLQREYDSTGDPFEREKNSYSPIEQFIFSPSLIAATPNLIRQADLTWQEAN